jgi:uncharacterized protein YlzI (FlbEa/FlbD family)
MYIKGLKSHIRVSDVSMVSEVIEDNILPYINYDVDTVVVPAFSESIGVKFKYVITMSNGKKHIVEYFRRTVPDEYTRTHPKVVSLRELVHREYNQLIESMGT